MQHSPALASKVAAQEHKLLGGFVYGGEMRSVVPIGFALLVASCAGSQFDDAMKRYYAEAEQCQARHAQGDIKSYRDTAVCMNEAQSRIVAPFAANNDNLAQEEAYRLVIANKLDKKMITVEQANVLTAQFRPHLAPESPQAATGNAN
jgi:hypothetical protein